MRFITPARCSAFLGIAAVVLAATRATFAQPALIQFDRALTASARYLQSRQSEDGAWRSPVYGTFKQGDALTPLVVMTLAELPDSIGGEANPAIAAGQRYLSTMIADSGEVLPPRHGVTYPVYTAAGAIIALTQRPADKSAAARDAWLRYLRQRQLTEALGWTRRSPVRRLGMRAGLAP